MIGRVSNNNQGQVNSSLVQPVYEEMLESKLKKILNKLSPEDQEKFLVEVEDILSEIEGEKDRLRACEILVAELEGTGVGNTSAHTNPT